MTAAIPNRFAIPDVLFSSRVTTFLAIAVNATYNTIER